MKSGRLTCAALVDAYFRRIEAYDKQGPALNAITVVNPQAREQAADLDRRLKSGGLAGPLHCIPFIVKDNFETIGLQTAAGSLALKDFDPGRDAFQVKRIKEAGAIVLAKSNMAEWAFSPYETVGSVLPGYTRNPYALDRVTAGSSGGTAAAVAASFGAVGLGSDTGNSIRGPSSHQALAGIRSTMGLTSRSGVVPLNLLADIAGPMARTLEDAVTVFQVIVGEDPADPVTLASAFEPSGLRPGGRPTTIPDYRASLVKTGLKGSRIGVLRQAYERESTSPEVVSVFTSALEDMKKAGATVVDPATVEGLNEIRRPQGAGSCGGFKHDINRYLASLGERVPVKNLEGIIRSRRFHPSVELRLTRAQEGQENPLDSAACKAEADYRERFRSAVLEDDADAFARRVRVSRPGAIRLVSSVISTRRTATTARCSHRSPASLRSTCRWATRWREAPGGRHVFRPRVGRGDADPARLLVRAGHPASASARDDAGVEAVSVTSPRARARWPSPRGDRG